MKIRVELSKKVGDIAHYNEEKVESGNALVLAGNVARINKHYTAKRLADAGYANNHSAIKNRFAHIIVSLDPKDNLSNREFKKLGLDVMSGLGLKNNQFMMYRHFDREHQHIHIVASRVDFDNKLVRDSFYGLKCRKLERELEENYGLITNKDKLLTKEGVRQGQKYEIERMNKSQKRSVRQYVQESIIESLQEKPSLEVFIQRLNRRGVDIAFREVNRGEKKYLGLSYTMRPDLMDIEFKEKHQFGIVGDKQIAINFKEEEVVELEGVISGKQLGRIAYNNRNIPEFVPDGVKPDEYKGYSFRAAQLGPFFKVESLKNRLSDFDDSIVKLKTVEFKGRPKPEYYQAKPVLSRRITIVDNKLLLAAEKRSAGAIREVLNSDLIDKKVINFERYAKLTTQATLDFLVKEIDKNLLLLKPELEKSKTTSFDKKIELSKVYEEYISYAKRKPNLATKVCLDFIEKKDWIALEKHLVKIIDTNDVNLIPDVHVRRLKDLPLKFGSLFLEVDQVGTWVGHKMNLSEQEIRLQEIRKNTDAFIKLIESADNDELRDFVRKVEVDAKKIPFDKLILITDVEILRLLNLDSNLQEKNKKDKKENDKSNKFDNSLGKGYDKGEGNDLESELGEDIKK